MRAIDASRTALGDEDPRVRLAGAEALVHLNAPDAAGAIAKLAKDDATAVDALRLARSVQSDDVTRAAIARTAPGEETSIREAAVSALGAQSSDGAMHALAELATDPVVGGDAVAAIARSPGRGAMATLERLARGAQGGAARRLAARGYLVRRLARGDRSAPLDELLRSLASAADVSDRALGVQSLVALGARTGAAALADADTRVRRAAVLGAMAGWAPGSGEPLLARMAVEPDAGTRAALALGWADASARADGTPTAALIDLARAGGPDAPLAATALARRGVKAPVPRPTRSSRDAIRCSGRTPRAASARARRPTPTDASSERTPGRAPTRCDARSSGRSPAPRRRRRALGGVDADPRARGAPRPGPGHALDGPAGARGPGARPPVPGSRGGVASPEAGGRGAGDGGRPGFPRPERRPGRTGVVRRRRVRPRSRGPAGRGAPPPCAERAAVFCSRTMSQRTAGPAAEAPPNADPKAGTSFEAAIKRLTEIVQQLERGDLPLEESLRLFEEGVKLSRISQRRLDGAEKRVEQLLAVDDEGQPRTAPFATDATSDESGDD